MSKLNLRDDYLGSKTDLIVKEHDRSIVSVQVGGICHEQYRPPLTTQDLATIVSTILKENRHFALQCLSPTIDGAILCLVQVIPESFVIKY